MWRARDGREHELLENCMGNEARKVENIKGSLILA